jgi:hypothetical protein
MFGIIAVLLTLDRVSKDSAERLLGFFNPALNWVQRWLPLFYVPTLVVLPLAVRSIPGVFLAVSCSAALAVVMRRQGASHDSVRGQREGSCCPCSCLWRALPAAGLCLPHSQAPEQRK